MAKVTDNALRVARTRRLKKQIAATIEQARHAAWDRSFRICAAENPGGRSGAFVRWLDESWQKATKGGAHG